uniref:Major facilitator superfamily (MFS) profile domain-containing protein n=1 Tax=Clastoptera arizonana TaxID=38151 RepID=A0A1B6CLP1_9HEMI
MTSPGVLRQIIASVSAALTALSSGFAYGWSSPILPHLLKPDSILPMTPDESSWVVVVIELGAAFTALPAGLIIDKFGRRKSLLLCFVPFTLSWLLVIFTRSVTMLIISRFIQGMTIGVVFCACPVYITELAQPSIRGTLAFTIITTWYMGFIFVYTVGSYCSYNTTAYISMLLSAVYVIPLYYQPESPYYYVLKNRSQDAIKSLTYYRNARPSDVKDEMKAIEEYVKEEKSQKSALTSIFADPISRRCVMIMAILCSTTNFSGITATYAYATKIFSTSSETGMTAEEYSIIISVLLLVVNIVATYLIEKVGRRVLVLTSCVGCSFSTSLAAIFFYMRSETKINTSNYDWVPLLLIGGYCVSISIGLNPLATSFQGELFPANTRSLASGITAFSLAAISSACLKVFFLIDTNIGMYFNYVMFTFVTGFGFILLYIYMPETKNKTFAQIQRELNERYNKSYAVEKDLLEPINTQQ